MDDQSFYLWYISVPPYFVHFHHNISFPVRTIFTHCSHFKCWQKVLKMWAECFVLVGNSILRLHSIVLSIMRALVQVSWFLCLCIINPSGHSEQAFTYCVLTSQLSEQAFSAVPCPIIISNQRSCFLIECGWHKFAGFQSGLVIERGTRWMGNAAMRAHSGMHIVDEWKWVASDPFSCVRHHVLYRALLKYLHLTNVEKLSRLLQLDDQIPPGWSTVEALSYSRTQKRIVRVADLKVREIRCNCPGALISGANTNHSEAVIYQGSVCDVNSVHQATVPKIHSNPWVLNTGCMRAWSFFKDRICATIKRQWWFSFGGSVEVRSLPRRLIQGYICGTCYTV